jgi:hypothetical protein
VENEKEAVRMNASLIQNKMEISRGFKDVSLGIICFVKEKTGF